MEKKTKLAIIGVIALVLVTAGITYAYWLVTKTQTNKNYVGAGCLDISLTGEQNHIDLDDQFPTSDEDGAKLTPYEFTITNNCDTEVDYQIALESIGDEANAIAASSLKVKLNNGVSSLLSDKPTWDTTIESAYASHLVGFGNLAAKDEEGDSDTHELRLWIDANAPISEMNKTFESKISVSVGQGLLELKTLGELVLEDYTNSDGSINISEYPTPYSESEWGEEVETSVSTAVGYPSFGTGYELDQATGTFTLTGDVITASPESCKEGTKTCGQYMQVVSYDQYTSVYLVEDFSTVSDDGNTPPIYSLQAKKKTVFNNSAIKDGEYGLYETVDDAGTSYFLRGDVENNYVKLGNWKEVPVKYELYDEYNNYSIVGIYSTLDECEKAALDNNYYFCLEEKASANVGDPMYWRIVRINGDGSVRLVYDGTEAVSNDTDSKPKIGEVGNDEWYESNLKNIYGSYIADSIFCSSVPSTDRLSANFKCSDESSQQTVAGGQLTNPIGNLTTNEKNKIGTGTYSYLNGNAPVINIKADVKFMGAGTIEDPYVLVME